MNSRNVFNFRSLKLRKILLSITFIISLVISNAAAPVLASPKSSTYKVTWATMAPMPTARAAFGLASATNGKIYAMGGTSDMQNGISTVEEYNPSSNSWTTMASMPTARMELGLIATSDGKIYAIGGHQYVSETGINTILSTIEQYNPANNTWSTKADMPAPRFAFAVVEGENGKIYVIGGASETGGCLQSFEEYDPNSDKWTTLANMPTARSGMGAVFANGMIYVIGGQGCPFQELNTVEAYDPGTNTWQSKANMPTERGQIAAIKGSNGRIYAIGGKNSSHETLNTVEEYDPLVNTWVSKTGMPTARWLQGAAATNNGKFYVIGGSDACCSNTTLANNEQGTIAELHYAYLPNLSKPPVGLTGQVTMNGVPAEGIELDLRFYDGSSWFTIASTNSIVDGSYTFTNVPALASGQAYYVRYLNSNDSSRLWTWHSGVNSTYSGNSLIKLASFDIANITLLKPDSGSTVKLPFTFTWTKRPATLNDSYEFDLFENPDLDPWFQTDPPLGYVDSYKLIRRPANFLNGNRYSWWIQVHSPDGGYGISYYYCDITFNSSPGGIASFKINNLPKDLQSTSSASGSGIPIDR